jgi:uncharacterized membrane protein
LPLLYAAWAVPLLLALGWLTPPWQNPDEPLHMARAVQVAHGGLVGYRAWTTSGGDSDAAIYAAYTPVQHAAMQPAEHLSRADLAASNAVNWSPRTAYTSFPNTAQYPPWFYLPDAAAYWAGRALGLSINHTLLLSRAANALLFTLMATAALAIARRARPLLLAVLILPTTLSLACSASQDALMQGACALAVAWLDRIVSAGREAATAEALAITVLLACIGMARPPYAAFLLALGLLARQPWRPLLRYALPAAAIVLAWCLLVALHTSVRLGGADPARQLALLYAHPFAGPGLVLATLRQFALEWWVQFIGVLGWTDTRLPHAYILAATASVVLAAVASCAGPARSPWLPAAALAAAFAAILVLQYLAWTWPGQTVITGILGRYFTPFAMLLALALPRLGALPAGIVPLVNGATLALAAVTPAVTLHAIVLRYYINPP